MAHSQGFSVPFLDPAKLPDGIACVSRAWTHLAHGLVSASLAQIDLAHSMLAALPSEWPAAPEGQGSTEIAHHWVKTAQIRFDTTLKTYRQINDEFAARLFAAADSLADAATPATAAETITPPQAVPAAKAAAAKPQA